MAEPLQSVVRTTMVLDAFAGRSEWRVSELARYLRLPKAGVHRIVQSLETCGYLRQDDARGAYSLGGQAIALGRNALSQATAARPYRHLARLSEMTGAVALYYELRGHRYVCLERLDVMSVVPTTVEVGDTMGLHAGAGKSILAFQTDSFILQVLSARLPNYSGVTPASAADVRACLTEIRRRGYWVSRGEITPGTVGISAPVVTASGKVTNAICVSLQAPVADDFVRTVAAEVRQAALIISQEVGGTATQFRELSS